MEEATEAAKEEVSLIKTNCSSFINRIDEIVMFTQQC
jgi:ATP-dependent Clp protease ATP-binding subunit ClpA